MVKNKISKNESTLRAVEGVGKQALSYIANRDAEWYSLVEGIWWNLTQLIYAFIFSYRNPVLGTYAKNTPAAIQGYMCTSLLVTALFVIAKQ